MRRRPTHIAFILACVLALTVRVAAAQTVRGVAVSRGTGEPVNGGIVALLDSAGRAHAATIADDSGRFVIKAPAPGSYQLRVERVGFKSFLSVAFVLADAESRDVSLEVTSEATTLRAIRITADKRCLVRPKEGLAAAELWNEARKALDATRITLAQKTFGVRVKRFDRDLDPYSLAVRKEDSYSQAGDTHNPFVAVETSLLERYGFSRPADDGSTHYFAPDADVLLSDFFLDTHCFMAMPPIGSGEVGLIFEPIPARKVPEVKGVLWFDPATFELRSMQYSYVHLAIARDVPSERLGGRIVFSSLPNGRWYVRQWSIRMPFITEERARNPVTGMQEAPVHRLTAIKESGGEVLEVLAAGTAGRNAGVVTGVVFDSVKRAPLPGTRVFLSGTRFAATADSTGRYAIDAVPPGAFTLSIVQPRLDTLQLEPPAIAFTLSAGERKTVDVAVPSFTTLLASRCTGMDPSDSTAAILGVARDELTGKPAAGATVRVSWQRVGGTSTALQATEQMAEAVVEQNGRYTVCGLPPDKPVTIRAVRGKERGKDFSLRTVGRFIHRVDLRAPTAEP